MGCRPSNSYLECCLVIIMSKIYNRTFYFLVSWSVARETLALINIIVNYSQLATSNRFHFSNINTRDCIMFSFCVTNFSTTMTNKQLCYVKTQKIKTKTYKIENRMSSVIYYLFLFNRLNSIKCPIMCCMCISQVHVTLFLTFNMYKNIYRELYQQLAYTFM